jgi:hypothetical protein
MSGKGKDKQRDWRLELMLNAQQRFEQNFVQPTLAEIATLRSQLQEQAAAMAGPDAELRKTAIEADLQRLDGIEEKAYMVMDEARRTFRAQVGSGGFNPERLSSVRTKGRQKS